VSFDLAQGARALGARLGWAEVATCATRVLGEEPGQRLVIEYRLQPHGPVVVGKFYADRSGQSAYRALRGLDRVLARELGPSVLSLPKALFYDPDARFLAQQRVAGIPYPDLLGEADIRPFFERAGEALAVLHRQRVRVGRTVWLEDHLRDLIHPHPRHLARRWPEYEPMVTALLHTMTERERAWRAEIEPVPLHRDFHLRQLFFEAGQVGLIDWDLFARGDPALDVGNFLVYLQTHLAAPLADRARAAFVAGYGLHQVGASLPRVRFYQAFTYLRLACKSARRQAEGWYEQTWELLRTAARYLQSESPQLMLNDEHTLKPIEEIQAWST
jgi:aminoglycoside phosphotransferase (APT) family kinase protein